MNHSVTYDKSECCGDHCYAIHSEDKCWGVVEVVDEEFWGEDYCWVHACRGHEDEYFGGQYIKEPKETK